MSSHFEQLKTDHSVINGVIIENSLCTILLGIKIDNKLKFDSHINEMCKKAVQKLNAVARVSTYMNTGQKKSLRKPSSCHNSVTVH